MPIASNPEIIPPPRPERPDRRSGTRFNPAAGLFDDENLDILSHLLDDFLRIPGTPIRFGLDGIVGFLPGIGDILGGIASSILLVAAWVRGVAYVTLIRMVLNVAIETLVGSIPFFGNLFDIAWRANRRNYRLLTGSIENPARQTRRSWLVLGALCLVLAGLMLLPGLLLAWLLVSVLHRPGNAMR
jgi:hypothetical protein